MEKEGGDLIPNPCPRSSFQPLFFSSSISFLFTFALILSNPHFTLCQRHHILLRSSLAPLSFFYLQQSSALCVHCFPCSHWLCMAAVSLPATVITDWWECVCACVCGYLHVYIHVCISQCAYMSAFLWQCLWVSAHNCVCTNGLACIHILLVFRGHLSVHMHACEGALSTHLSLCHNKKTCCSSFKLIVTSSPFHPHLCIIKTHDKVTCHLCGWQVMGG